MKAAELPASSSLFARCGQRIFGWRLGVGLLAVLPAAFIIRPLPWSQLPLALQIAAPAGILLGLGLRAWAAAHAGGHTRSGVIEAARLACSGPYARVRNPIYLGNFILGLGMIALLGDAWLLPLHLVIFAVLYASIIPAEEQFLTRTFGAAYREYCSEVPRLCPRLLAWPGAVKIEPCWAFARGELRIAGLLIAIYALLMLVGKVRFA